MNTSCLSKPAMTGLFVAAALMLTLPSCDPYYGGGWGYGYPQPLYRYIPRPGRPYNYTYFPHYGAYYHHPSGQFHYLSGNNWMSGRGLPGHSRNNVLRSPGVPFNFNSHPSNYHNHVAQAFPHNWQSGKFHR